MCRRYATIGNLLAAYIALGATLLPGLAIAQDRADLGALTVIDAAGRQTSLAERIPDAPAIVHFWATWCIPCREELPQIDAFHQVLEREGLSNRFVVVSVDKLAFYQVAAFLEDDLGIGLETILVTNGNPGATLGLFGYPYTLTLNADGRIAERFPGPLQWADSGVSAQLRAHVAPTR
ncbi:TlpA family protein disulfide reductase [Pelagibacterium xiamenense]|uniref:TlpA family protein disulfide reductase n=1 Tax=Pelagibacterium xiamenense TaxID=2901140 RepID=UPI001E5ABB4E|nr:TlpA disulfide reductase family protein [Pelagibacterium xiamenense]MCD7060182.1 TlpA family protein disulfide reductase [Pelagibacterium xiamenense]